MTIRLRPLETLFALFLALVLVRIVPFSPRAVADVIASDAGTGTLKAILYGALFAAIAAVSLRRVGQVVRNMPLPFAALLLFCALSIAWSPVPDIAARRLVLTAIVSFALLLATLQLRPNTIIRPLRLVTVGLTLATLVAGLLLPALAIHQPGDPESSVVGAWRGIFYHKNLAGGVAGLAVLLAVERAVRTRRPLALAIAVLTILTLVLTRSKTSAVAVVVALAMLAGLHGARLLARRNRTQAVLLRAAILAGLIPALIAVWFLTDLGAYVLDPAAFTGRGELWGLITQLIEARPLLGRGYESVFQVGDGSALAQMSPQRWIRNAPHSHNGLLDALATVGAVGVVLFGWALVADPWRRVARLPDEVREAWQPLLAALIAYALIHSLMEGRLLSGDSIEWPLLVIVLGLSVRLTLIVRGEQR